MKTIGLIGGMSWESTVSYYRVINEAVKRELGGFHSAKILLYSVDFAEIEQCQAAGDWDKSAQILADAARRLEGAGADFVLICTNTMHKVAPQVAAGLGVPLVHIADATAGALKARGIGRVALLGTKYTMTQDFYRERIRGSGIEVMVPGEADIEVLNGIIFKELCLGKVLPESKKELLRIIAEMGRQGAEGIILGCTELGLLVSQQDTPLPVFDTALIHAEKAAVLALEG